MILTTPLVKKRVYLKSITFNDLIPLATTIVHSSAMVKNVIRQTYSDVFLDEFQDCTSVQYGFIKEIFMGTDIRLTVVGDIKQRIMKWAGAREGIFSDFQKDFNADSLDLYQNFRASPKIRRMQNRITRRLDPQAAMDDSEIKGDDGAIYVWGFENQEEEADYIIQQISHWIKNDSIPLNQIAILVSRQPHLYAQSIMARLQDERIPYRNEQEVQDLLSEPVVNLIVAFLLVVYGDREPESLSRLMNFIIHPDISDGQDRENHRWQHIISERRQQVSNKDQFPQVWLIVDQFLDDLGVDKIIALSPDYESKQRRKEIIIDFKSRLEKTITEGDSLISSIRVYGQDNSIRILTIHKSKGLEFSHVIIQAVEKETFWGNENEERCTYFVGVSRAKNLLALTHCKEREIPQSANDKEKYH